MLVMQISILLIVAVAGAAVVFTRQPGEQAIGISFFGLVLALMFFIFQAPDVALSQIVIGAVALPLMVLLAIAKVRVAEIEQRQKEERNQEEQQAKSHSEGSGASQDQHAADDGRPSAEGAR